MIVGQLEIQLLANMARLQSDMDKAKRFVGGAVDTMNKALGLIGAGISVVGITSLVKSVVDTGDKLNDLRKISGLTVVELGGLEKQAKLNGSSLDQVARAVGVMSKNMYAGSEAFKVLGIETRNADGTLRGVNPVLLDVADRFSRMEDGATKSALANQLFGKSGRDLIPMLSEGRGAIEAATASYAKNSGMTQKLAEDSDKFNDTLTMLNGRVTAIKTTFTGELLPALNNIGTAMLTATDGSNKFGSSAGLLDPILKRLAIAGYTVVDTFRGVGREIGARAAQIEALTRMDFGSIKFIGQALAEDNEKSRAAYDKFVDTVMNGDKALEQLNAEQAKQLDLQIKLPGETDKATGAVGRQTKAFNMQVRMLKEYEREVAGARDIEYRRLKDHEEMLKRVAQITQSVATKQEIYNQTVAELDWLKPRLGVDIYTRALEKAERELNDVNRTTRHATDEMSQLWMQAGRNIQSTLANSIFDFFNGGLDDMWRNAKMAVGRILSEFAALKLAQSIGLTAMFAVPGTAAAGTGAAASGGLSALNIASMASGGLNLLKTGFGVPSLLGSVGSYLPGSAGAFFGGMAMPASEVAAASFASSGWGAAGVSSAASMGASFASIAGPAIAIAAVDQITRLLAGDKLIGGGVGKVLNYVPVLGPLLNALFGRGPLKQKETSLTGMIGAEGFESGMLQTHFKAKGSVFVGSKHDYARIDAITGEIWTDNQKQLGEFAKGLSGTAKEIFGLFNDTSKQTAAALREIGKNLGIGIDGIDKFSYSVKLVSEKGKMLTEEQIGEEIEKITDGLAHSLIPEIDELAKRGETAMQAVSRLNAEFGAVNSAAIALGLSFADARTYVQGMGFELRNEFVEAGGGLEAFTQRIGFIADNFLTEEQKLAVKTDSLHESMNKLSVPLDTTKEGFYALLKAAGAANDTVKFGGLLEIAPLFLEISNASELLAKSAREAAEATRRQAEAIAAAERRAFVGERRAAQNKDAELYSAGMERITKALDALIAADKYYLFDNFYKNRISKESLSDSALYNQARENFSRAGAAEFIANTPMVLEKYAGLGMISIEAMAAALEKDLAEIGKTAGDTATKLSKAADERQRLEDQLFGMTASLAEKRSKELSLLDPSNRALQERIFALQDEQDAAQAAAQAAQELAQKTEQIAQQRYGLETQLLQLQGNTAELRQRELAALDPSNQFLQRRIWQIEDERAAVEQANAAMETLRGNVGTAFDALQKSVDAERKSIGRHIDDIAKSVDKLRSLSGSLQSTLGRMQIPSNESFERAAAQAQISTALAIAKASGVLPNAESLSRALDVVAQPSEDLYGSFVDYMRDFARTASDINELARLTQGQLDQQDIDLRVAQDQLTALDGILSATQLQIDAINGVDVSIQSVASALSSFQSAALAAQSAAINGASAPPISAIVSTAPEMSTSQLYQIVNARMGASAESISTVPELYDAARSLGIPGYADGGFHRGGLRIVGENGPELEYTGPSRIFSNAQSRDLLDLSAVLAELKALHTELTAIKANTGASAGSNQRTADLLDDVSAGGGPLLVTQVA